MLPALVKSSNSLVRVTKVTKLETLCDVLVGSPVHKKTVCYISPFIISSTNIIAYNPEHY